MKNKKIIFSTFCAIIIGISVFLQNPVKAASISPIYFGVKEYRSGTIPDNMAYAIGDPTSNSTTQTAGAKIWNIQKFPSASATNGTDGNYYCVKAGVGFQNTNDIETYNMAYDLKNDKSVLSTSTNTYVRSLVNGQYYNNLMALTDLLYLKDVSTDAEKTELENKLEIGTNFGYENTLTDDDYEAVQQAAIWYFTNNESSIYSDIYNKDSWLFYNTTDRAQNNLKYESLEDYGFTQTSMGQAGPGLDRNEQANILLKYLIDTANENASKYANGQINSTTKVTLYLNGSKEDAQPIIEIGRIPEVKEFDLALRKYITKVDGQTLSSNVSRVPNIDETTLKTDTTATYKHKKDPVEVSTGSVVTYSITVYNEGEKVGRATKIIDQLPTGLRFTKLITSGFSSNYDEETNRLTITRESSNTNNLNAYTTGKLDSETIEIECTVTQVANTENEIILTNVAWIAEEYDADANKIITNTHGDDRDSEPLTTPNVNKDNMSDYKGNSSNKDELNDSNYFYKGEQDDDDFEKIRLPKLGAGSYNLVLVKQDKNGEQLNSAATFTVNGVSKDIIGKLVIANNVSIDSSNYSTPDVYEIKETKAPDKYCEFTDTIKITVTKKLDNGTYKIDNVEYNVFDENGQDVTNASKKDVKVYLNSDGNIYVEVKNYQFDLKLVKRIVEVNGKNVPERIKNIDITKLANGTETTADYDLNKNPYPVETGSIVKYTLRVYNEGEIDGYASEISEDIPEGLEFLWSNKLGTDLDNDGTLTNEEKEAIKYNQKIWDVKTINQDTNKIEMVTTNYLAKGKGDEISSKDANLINAFNSSKEYTNKINDKNPDYKEISIYMKVVSTEANKVIRNEAAITGDTDKNGNPVNDRDSKPEDWVKYEDDEDYDQIILKPKAFDLALRKFIIAVSKDEKISDSEYLKNINGTYKRAPIVDTSKLDTIDENGNMITTAIYNHTKEPVVVAKNDYVVYMIRVYNEGDIPGYASEIKDHLPEQLEFVKGEFNDKYGWNVSTDGRTVKTTYLDNYKIDKKETNEDGVIVLSYKEVPIMCKVKENAPVSTKITNIADITVYKDENKVQVDKDRDSEPKNVNLPSDWSSYKDNEQGNYIPGQQDDDDFEKIIIKKFDLALRKFITKVNNKNITTRIPEISYDKNSNKITYNHTKEPVPVATNNIVTYTIRVFNEGEVSGFASKVSDDIPVGLEFLPDNETNKEYRWVMYDKEGNKTTDVSKAQKITTDYLSKEQGESRMKEDSLSENPALLNAFNSDNSISDSNPDYADLKVAFKVTEPNNSNRIIVNSAQISDDTDENGNPIEDDDSTPDEWIDGEDDQDKEYIKLMEFDLALRKFITKVNDDDIQNRIPEVTYDKEKNQITYNHTKEPVQVATSNIVTYTIRVFNEGEIAGFASVISDDIPNGLKFLPDNEINKEYRWVMYDKEGKETQDVSKAVKVATDYLSKEQSEKRMGEDSSIIENPALLNAFNKDEEISNTNPDYADVLIAFKVIEPNSSDRVIVNSAQISDDEDEDGNPVQDKDSTPDEWNEGEDDQDREYIKLMEFDLALRKWVTQAIVIENGKQTVTQTGHTAEQNPEPVVKVELNRKKLSTVTVKFNYSIRITNEGDIEGYAKEIKDYIPQGLKFVAQDNKDWKDEGNNVISTRQLENTLLKPGESKEISVILTWINGNNNLGQKINLAEISEDYNEFHVPDRDSTPNNKKLGEDDIDDAPVILSIKTGAVRTFFTLGIVTLIILAGGITLIKKYVI